MNIFSRDRSLTAGAVALFLTAALPATATICIWTNTSGGNWNNPANWSPNQVPGLSDTATITNLGTYTVSLDVSPAIAALTFGSVSAGSTQTLSTGSASLTVSGLLNVGPQGQLNLTGGTLTGTIMLQGSMSWSGGNLTGILTAATNSVLNIGVGGGFGFKGIILTNYGTVNWNNTTLAALNGNSQFYNYGAWNAQSDNIFYGGYNGGQSLFDNFGTFVKTGNTGTTTLDGNLVFNNYGTVQAQSGTLTINGGGTNSENGNYGAINAGTLVLNGMDFANGASFGSASSVQLGGITTVNGSLTGTNIQLINGTLTVESVLNGTLTWSGGSLAGVLTGATNSVLNIVSGGGFGFKGMILTNYGTVNWGNTTLAALNGNSQFYNYGAWNAQSDNIFYGGYNGGQSLFDNFGTFVKTGNTGITTLDGNLVFNNYGTVQAQSGTLAINGGGTNSGNGNYGTANGGSLVLDGINFANGASFGGTSSVQLGGTSSINGGLTGTNLQLTSGTLSVAGMLNGNLTWSGGNLAGTLTIPSNSVLNIVSGGGFGFKGMILTNFGTVNWGNANLAALNGNTQIYNYGTWDVQNDYTFFGGYNGGQSVFDNFGTVVKSAGANNSDFDGNLIFNNHSNVLATSGTLTFSAGTTDSASIATSASGTVNLQGFVLTNTNTFTGSSNFLNGGTKVSGAIAGTLNWTGGSLSGWMVVTTNGVFNISSGAPNFAGLTLTNYGSVNCSNVTLIGASGLNAQIYNYGVWQASGANTFRGGQSGGTSLFENFGTFVNTPASTATVLDSNVKFLSGGSVDVQGGTLNLQGTCSFTGPMSFEIGGANAFGTLALANAQNLSGIPVSVNFIDGYVPTPGSQYQLVSSPHLSGQFTTLALPFGMSFNYSKTNATILFGGLTEATWAAGASALHGTNIVNFLLAPGTTVELLAVLQGGASTVLGTASTSGFSSFSFDTTHLSNSPYSLQAVVSNAAGPVGTYSRDVFVNNSLSWHEGILTGNQTWGANSVNAVDQPVIIPTGVTLTIAPGAVVKFATGASIVIEPGGTLDASGATASAPIIFTSLKDDSVGGDSDEDDGLAIPEAGDWNGIDNLGQFNSSVFVQIRYVIQSVGGPILANAEWTGAVEYVVTGNITVSTNVTLTIDPGAIIKFQPGLNITVEAGGKLIAKGNVAQPIIFTSINDQSVGANTNGVPTTPDAGDWDSIYLNGGQAVFDHVTLSYGGGPDSLNSGLISLTAAGASASVSDSILTESLYKGIQAEYGTVNVTNCLVTGCDRGIQPGLSGPTTVNIVNCTIDQNNWGVVAHGGAVNIINTIISDSFSYGLYVCCGSALGIYEHNDLWSTNGVNYAGVASQTGINGNISANPQFVNPLQGNYELNYGSPCINAGDGAAAPLTDILGAPCYNYPGVTNPTGTTNVNGVYPDIGTYEFSAIAPSDIDLMAANVIGPSQLTAGQAVTVQWNDVNTGSGAATGPWHDTVSLVLVKGGDPVAGTVLVAQNTTLGPGQSYAASATVVVPPGVIGDYRWQVLANSRGEVFEGLNWSNNAALALAISSLTDPMAVIGGSAVSNQFTAVGQSTVYAVDSSGGTFVIDVQGATPHCALQVFVGRGYVPDSAHFDFQSSEFDSPTASVTVPGTTQDTYYILVVAVYLDAPTVGFSLTATPLEFMLDSVNPSQVGNSGPVTLQVLGNELTTNDLYVLIGQGVSFTNTSAEVSDPTVAYVTFNLAGAKPGTYTLQVSQPDPATLTLSNAVTIVGSSNVSATPTFLAHLELPTACRKAGAFTGEIVYQNTGNVDMRAPLLFLKTGGSGKISTPGKPTPVSTKGFLAKSPNGRPGTLRPGGKGRIPFIVQVGGGSVNITLIWITIDNSITINWPPLKQEMQPPTIPDNEWDPVWQGFLDCVGDSYGSLDDFLGRLADFVNDDPDFAASLLADYGIDLDDFDLGDIDDILSLGYQIYQAGFPLCLQEPPPTADENPPDSPVPPVWDGTVVEDNPPENPATPTGGGGGGSSSETVPVVASSDPNAKFATGNGTAGWLAAQDSITYTIDFANETNATAPAQIVTITDRLSTNLDWSTFQLTSVSFNNANLYFEAGVQSLVTNAAVSTDPNSVSVTASLNPTNGVVTWVIESINPVTGELVTDPLAGFLPPDNVSGQGEGSVTYTVMPVSGLGTGMQISNQASIVFDVNAAIATPAITNTIDATPPSSSMTPLPAVSPSSFTVSWSGSDAGSGIAGFNIFISTNNGPWTFWLAAATNTSAQFTSTASNTYSFYSVAYDLVGNVQTNVTIPGATTTVSSVQPPTIAIARSAAQSLTLTWSAGTLQESTNLLGPWLINSVPSPYVVLPTNKQVYFRLVQ